MAKEEYNLNIGSKRYSSWSLRVWLLMMMKDVAFDERLIPFINVQGKREFNDETKRNIASVSKTAKLPSLSNGSTTLSESLPILEFLNEAHPDKNLWPVSSDERAHARMLAGAIYSGFHGTKLALPFLGDGRRKENPSQLEGTLEAEMKILQAILLETNIGSSDRYLYGDFTIADAMLIPLLMRYRSYNVIVSQQMNSYIEFAWNSHALQKWIAEAQVESERIEDIEQIYSAFPKRAEVKYKL